MRKSSLKAASSAVLLCLLIAVEAMALVHSLDFDAHSAGEPCKICIGAAAFGAAAPAEKPAVPAPSAASFDIVVSNDPDVPARAHRPTARAPPQAS